MWVITIAIMAEETDPMLWLLMEEEELITLRITERITEIRRLQLERQQNKDQQDKIQFKLLQEQVQHVRLQDKLVQHGQQHDNLSRLPEVRKM